MEYTDEEIEAERLVLLNCMSERQTSAAAPGSLYMHEAFHTAYLVGDMIDINLLSHPSIVTNPKLFKMAWEAGQMVYGLYQAIGEIHMADEGE